MSTEGESSRTSISPGAPTPAQEMQQMMRLMQKQMQDMMKNVESNMSRSLAAVSTDVMKQVTIMLRQHDAELTSRVDMMMNSASTSNTNDSPTVTLQDGTTLHDYDEETGMHAHDSPHASRVSDEEDEFKYDGESVPTVPDPSRDADERRASHPVVGNRDRAPLRSHDHRTCARCDMPALGQASLCSVHQVEYDREQRDAEQRRQDELRRKELQEAQRRQRDGYTTSTSSAVTPTLSAVRAPVDQQAGYSIMVSPYGTPTRDTVKEETVNRRTVPPVPTSAQATDVPKLVAESVPYTYQVYDRMKQEDEVRAARLKKDEYERFSMMSDVDKYDEATSVLGSILTRAFTPEMRRMMRYSKLPPTIRLSAKDRISAVGEMKAHGVTFSGERMKAPFYLRKLCTTIIRYDLLVGEVYQVMTLTMTGQAESWLQSEWSRCGEIPEHMKPVQALLDGFIDKWMDNITRTMYRDSLRALRMLSETATLDDLNKHYAKFNELLTGLRMCDRHVDMMDIRFEFFKSLPNKCKSFVGDTYMSADSIDDIHKRAERALITMHTRGTPRSDGDLPDIISVNAMPTQSGRNQDTVAVSSKQPAHKAPAQQVFTQTGRREVVCWHCGDKGHFAGLDCPLIRQDQTKRGQSAWALANKTRPHPRPYDKNFFIKKSKQIASGSASSTSSAGARRGYDRRPMKTADIGPRQANVDLEDEEDSQ
jgi:hypothetical protein